MFLEFWSRVTFCISWWWWVRSPKYILRISISKNKLVLFLYFCETYHVILSNLYKHGRWKFGVFWVFLKFQLSSHKPLQRLCVLSSSANFHFEEDGSVFATHAIPNSITIFFIFCYAFELWVARLLPHPVLLHKYWLVD